MSAYTWDQEPRITSITRSGMPTHTFAYNGLDTRVSKMVGGTLTTYLRSGAYVTDGVLRETSGSVTTHHTPGISERRGATATRYLHSGLKNADARTSGQAIDATRQYDAFGNLTSSSGSWPGPFGYAGGFGYQEDAESGLMLLGHRYYDATTGRFLSKDPVEDGRNWYAYCANNPTNSTDPSGLVKIILFWYHVAAGGYHAGIIVIDNAKGAKNPSYSFSGGPTKYGLVDNGKLISRSGPWKLGTQDYGRWDGGGIVLVDDDSPAGQWIDRLARIEQDMASDTTADYSPLPAPWGNTGNSNSWAAEFVKRSGLSGPYDKGRKKRGGTPWVPGWGKDVWN